MSQQIFIFHAASCFFMTGVIWFVQMVHYPLFESYTKGRFPEVMQEHQRRTSWVVVPVMLIELFTGIWLLYHHFAAWSSLLWVLFILLLFIWASTFLLQVKQHQTLLKGYQKNGVAVLVSGNWLRTSAWTLRSIGLLWILALH